MKSTEFLLCFERLTGHAPFGWQERLYERLLTGDIPSLCDIPTGLGKTSVLAVWLFALAEQASHPETPLTLPRRLVYIVDRRAVVDQATTEAESLLRRLQDTDNPHLLTVAKALRGLAAIPAGDSPPFALSTLRGQFADNREWSHDPTRPAIIVGTVDMIGSRLLFSGYGGLGRYGRSQHAGLLGQDALIVLDEAQLAPAFLQTLTAIGDHAQSEAAALGRLFAVMSLTATQPRQDEASGLKRKPLALEPEDVLREETVRRRVQAPKALRFVDWEGPTSGKTDDAVAQRMAQEAVALAGMQGAVVVFANTVSVLDRVRDALRHTHNIPPEHTLAFNGQMRSYERDRRFSEDPDKADPVYQLFRRSRKDRAAQDHPVFLLATSAGEVGVNFDADHAVCDLATLERMAQRLGRVNRAGEGSARIAVFLPADLSKPGDAPLAETRDALRQLPSVLDADGQPFIGIFSASPENLGAILKGPSAWKAYAPTSEPPPLDPARLDDWSLTSLAQDDFPRPQVSYWLRGITPDDNQAITNLVWREELRYAANKEDVIGMAVTRPPLPREILQLPTYRAAKWLLARAKKHSGNETQASPYHGERAAILTPAGEWESWRLSDLEDREEVERLLRGATIILPTTLGGLSKDGTIDESVDAKASDVLEETSGKADPSAKAYRRVLLQASADGGWKPFQMGIDLVPIEIPFAGTYPAVIRAAAGHLHEDQPKLIYRHLARDPEPEGGESEDDGPTTTGYRVEYFASTRAEVNTADEADEPSLRGRTVPLQEHLDQTAAYAKHITSRLDLPPLIQEVVEWAAKWHDLGKNRDYWQTAVGNPDPEHPWAKSNRVYFDRRATAGYRHEFGSLLDARRRKELDGHPERDLVLHLIAAHHGHGRPDFSEVAYDHPRYHLRSDCAAAAKEAELRFDKLQRRFGWWGLAYLEALVKCADALASDAAEREPITSSPPAGASNQPELFSHA